MTDYNSLKVPELKKLLQDRSLPISGNKADLIARLQENDKGSAAPAAGDDEIDWDEDENKATTAPAAAAIAAGGQGQVANPVAVPNQKLDTDPAKTNDLKVTGGNAAPAATDGTAASTAQPTSAPASSDAKEEKPKVDYTMGLGNTDAESEAVKRANRMKRFGIVESEEDKKLEERAKKFSSGETTVVKGLDEALPERKPKRGREGGAGQGGRNAKRQTPDRRAEAKPAAGKENGAKKGFGKILEDPVEAAKAEARAKRFAAGS